MVSFEIIIIIIIQNPVLDGNICGYSRNTLAPRWKYASLYAEQARRQNWRARFSLRILPLLLPRLLCNQSHLTNPMQIFPYSGRSPLNWYKWRLIHIKKSAPDLFNCLKEVAGMFLDLFFVSRLNPKQDTGNARTSTVNLKTARLGRRQWNFKCHLNYPDEYC